MRPAEAVITGAGLVGACGAGMIALERALDTGAPRASAVDPGAGYHGAGASRTAAWVDPADLDEWIPPLAARRMCAPSRYAVAAARLACVDAALDRSVEARPGMGVSLATAFGPSAFTERLVGQILREGPRAASPMLFAESVANAPAAQVSLHLNATGCNFTFSAREAGPLVALGNAASRIVRAREEVILAGAVDEMTPLLHAVLDRSLAIARPGDDGLEVARPFDRLRSGFLAAEGATVVVVESAAAARARGATVLARIAAWGRAFDATASSIGWGTGADVLARGLVETLDRAGLCTSDVDLIVSGASGSIGGDRLEARTLATAWATEDLPPIMAPKGVTGEYGGLFLAAALLALSGRCRISTAGFRAPDPELGIVPVSEGSVASPGVVLVSALGSGGIGSWVVLLAPAA